MSHNSFIVLCKRRLLSALLFISSALSWGETQVGADWLERFAHMDELNFRGVLTYSHGDQQESLRVTHGMYNGELYERLEHLDGARREVIRRGEQLTCIQLGQRLDRLLHRHSLKAGLANLGPYYAVDAGDETRIAGRRAITLQIKSRDELRYGYRLALDYDTGLLLRFEALNHAGRVLERLQFVDVEIGQPIKQEWLGDAVNPPVQKTADPMPIERVIEEEQMAWKPQWLPPGFSLALAPHRPSDDALTYSDGLAVLSIFIESVNDPLPQGEGSAMQGATVGYTRPLQLAGKSLLILVVGEVPPETAKRVADSVVWTEAPQTADAAR